MFPQFLVLETAEIIIANHASSLRICVIIFFGIFHEVITFRNFLSFFFGCIFLGQICVCLPLFLFIVLGSCIPKSINYLGGVCV